MAKNIYRYTNLKDESLKLCSIQEYVEAEKKLSQLDKEIGEIPVKERIPFYHLRTQEFSKLIFLRTLFRKMNLQLGGQEKNM